MDHDYHSSQFNDLVERFPCDDNHAPSLTMVHEFCESVDSWLSSDPKNVVFIHCMASKGRIGLMVTSYLVYKGMSADEALEIYANKRTKSTLGAMILSQQRYLNYWQKSLSFPEEVNLPKPCTRELREICLYDTKSIETVFFVVSEMQEVFGQRYSSPADRCRKFCQKTSNNGFWNSEIEEEEAQTCLNYYFNKSVQLTGDVCVTFYEKNIGGRLFCTCFNTAFIENNSIQFSITGLDKVGNKGKTIAGPEFRVELLFSPANSNPNE